MKNIYTTALAAVLTAAPAFAQGLKFDGFSLGVNLNFPSTSVEYQLGGVKQSKSNNTNDAAVQLAYSFRAQDTYVFGVGATYSPGDIKGGTVNYNSTDYDWIGKDNYSLYVEPGVLVSPKTLAYGKLSFQGASGELKSSAGTSSRDDYTGYGFGLGVRTLLNANVYVQAEIMQVNYNEKSSLGLSAKPSSTLGNIGLGYQF